MGNKQKKLKTKSPCSIVLERAQKARKHLGTFCEYFEIEEDEERDMNAAAEEVIDILAKADLTRGCLVLLCFGVMKPILEEWINDLILAEEDCIK